MLKVTSDAAGVSALTQGPDAAPEDVGLRPAATLGDAGLPPGGSVGSWLADRLGLRGIAYPVPTHANRLPYILGGITLTGFVFLFVTGIYLAQFYHPHPADAHDSVVYIMTGAPLGGIVRSVHYWIAQVVVVTVLLHLVRAMWYASYKRPREVNYLVGLGLLAVTMGLAYTGTVLKFDQEGIEALAHNTAFAEFIGGFGTWFSTDFSQSVPLLTRVFVGHTALLPLVFVLLIAAHVFLIKQHGISPKVTFEAESRATAGEGDSHFDVHVRRMLGFGLLLLALALGLSLAWPAPLGQPGVAGVEVTKPPWMFVALLPVEQLWGVGALIIAPLVLGAFFALVPFVDRTPYMHPARRKAILAAVASVALLAVAAAVFAELQPVQQHLNMAVMK